MTELPQRDVAWSAPPEQRPGADLLVPFSLADGVVLVLWSLLGQLLVGASVVVALTLAGVDPAQLRGASLGAVSVVTQSLVLAGALAWLAGRGVWSWRLFGARRPAFGHLLAGLGGGFVAFLAAGAVILAGDALVGPLEQPSQTLLDAEMLAGPALVLTVVIAVVLAPLLEEVVFRGVLFQAVGRRSGWVTGLVVSSLVFAVVHVEVVLPLGAESVVYGLALAVVGAVLGWVFHRSRSLVAAMVAHAAFNAIQLALATQAGGTGALVG